MIVYSNWKELKAIVSGWLPLFRLVPGDTAQETGVQGATFTQLFVDQDRDEALLLSLCLIAVGCDFEIRCH